MLLEIVIAAILLISVAVYCIIKIKQDFSRGRTVQGIVGVCVAAVADGIIVFVGIALEPLL